jgi:predicted phage terminase large subunit-like protein
MFGVPLTIFDVSKNILGYEDMTTVHEEWGKSYEDARKNGCKRILRCKPRGTFKTTFYTISGIIDILIEDYVKHGQFTESILILSATDLLAANILSEITAHLERNDTLLDIFDPNREGYISKKTQTSIKFKNSAIMKEPNIMSAGVTASIVSSHFSICWLDDVSNSEDRFSPTVRQRKCDSYVDLISILKPGGMMVVIGTRWAKGDIIDMIIKTNPKLPEKDRYDIEIDGVYDENGNLKYPTIYDEEQVERLKVEKGKVEFASQYLNVLLSTDTMIFDYDDFGFYIEGDTRPGKYIDWRECSHYQYCDPALGKELDYTVLITAALYDNKLYIRDVTISNTLKVSKLIRVIKQKYNEYHCSFCGIETNGFQSLIADKIKEENEKIPVKNRIKIKEVKNYKKKEVRIEGLEPFVSSKKVIFRDDWEKAYPVFIEQIVNYPSDEHDDAPDALEALVRLTINKKSDAGNYNKSLTKFMCGVIRGTRR